MFKVQIATGSIRRTNIAVSSTAGSTVSHQHQLWSDIRCRGQMLETECVGDKFEMLVTVLVTVLRCWWRYIFIHEYAIYSFSKTSFHLVTCKIHAWCYIKLLATALNDSKWLQEMTSFFNHLENIWKISLGFKIYKWKLLKCKLRFLI